MSLASKIALLLGCGFTLGMIYYVHAQQEEDIRKMHEGVIRDKERQRARQAEKDSLIVQQAELKKMLTNQNRDKEVVLTLLENAKESGN